MFWLQCHCKVARTTFLLGVCESTLPSLVVWCCETTGKLTILSTCCTRGGSSWSFGLLNSWEIDPPVPKGRPAVNHHEWHLWELGRAFHLREHRNLWLRHNGDDYHVNKILSTEVTTVCCAVWTVGPWCCNTTGSTTTLTTWSKC